MYKCTCRLIWLKKVSEPKKDKFTNFLNICNWFLSKGHVLGPIKGFVYFSFSFSFLPKSQR